MTGESVVLLIIGTLVAFVFSYVLWPVVKETRIAYLLWVWLWKRRG